MSFWSKPAAVATPTSTVNAPDRSFWTSVGDTLGSASTSSVANAELFADGFRAGYAGSQQQHAARRQQMRDYLTIKYGLK